MTSVTVTPAKVVTVLLADGWHRIVPGSFTVGPLGLDGGADTGELGFRFEESDAGSPYRPAALAGPLTSILAVRQAGPRQTWTAPSLGDPGTRVRPAAARLTDEGRGSVAAAS